MVVKSQDPEASGYSRPPKRTRFQKGQSGNPRGRPKGGPKNLATIVESATSELVEVREHGRPRRISKLEVAVKQLVNKAASGDLRAVHQLLNQIISEKQITPPSEAAPIDETDQKVMQGIVERLRRILTENSDDNS